MKQYLLPKEGNFYKANLHSHSTVSDGMWTPEKMKKEYMAKGYSIVAYTDHDIMIPHPELADADFLPLTSYEISIAEEDPEKTNFNQRRNCHLCLIAPTMSDTKQLFWHREKYQYAFNHDYIPAVNYDEETVDVEREYTKEFVNRVIAAARSAGYFVTYNHPSWSLESYPQYMAYEGYHALEIINGSGCAVDNYTPELSAYADMLRGGKTPCVIAGDDNHEDTDTFAGFTMIKAPSLTYPDVFAALTKGDCYASEAPLIEELTYEDGTVYVRTSPARSIVYQTDNRRKDFRNAPEGGALTEATFTVSPFERVFFLVVRDHNGRAAFTRAYSVDELKK